MTNPVTYFKQAFQRLKVSLLSLGRKTDCTEPKLSTKEKVKQSTIKLGLYYLLFSPLIAMPFYNTCIFHPFVLGDFKRSEINGVKKQDAFFVNKQGQRIHAWYFVQPGASKTVLVSHGNAGNITYREELIKVLLNSGASVFIYDYGGFGLSKGSPNVNGCIDDAIAAYDYLVKEKHLSPDSIVLYGESIGTGITCQLAKQRSCNAVILQSAFQSLPQIAQEKLPFFVIYPNWIFPVNQLDTLSYVKGLHPSLLLIHGEQDDLISAKNSQALYNAASKEKFICIVPKAGHNDVPENMNSECMQLLRRFCGP